VVRGELVCLHIEMNVTINQRKGCAGKRSHIFIDTLGALPLQDAGE